jgi:hypothetical protein
MENQKLFIQGNYKDEDGKKHGNVIIPISSICFLEKEEGHEQEYRVFLNHAYDSGYIVVNLPPKRLENLFV